MVTYSTLEKKGVLTFSSTGIKTYEQFLMKAVVEEYLCGRVDKNSVALINLVQHVRHEAERLTLVNLSLYSLFSTNRNNTGNRKHLLLTVVFHEADSPGRTFRAILCKPKQSKE